MKKQKPSLHCPNCGNIDLQLVTRKHQYRLSLLLLGLCLLGITLALFWFHPVGDVHNEVAYAIGFMTGFTGILTIAISRHACSRYKCKHCGHEFSHRK